MLSCVVQCNVVVAMFWISVCNNWIASINANSNYKHLSCFGNKTISDNKYLFKVYNENFIIVWNKKYIVKSLKLTGVNLNEDYNMLWECVALQGNLYCRYKTVVHRYQCRRQKQRQLSCDIIEIIIVIINTNKSFSHLHNQLPAWHKVYDKL